MSDINVSVLDQQLQLTSTPTVAAQGVNEDYIVFDFLDNSWSGFSMVALFFAEDNPEAVYQSVVNSAGRALVPWEATQTDGAMYFGLAGVNGNIRYTSELVRYKIVAGLYEGAESVEPTPSVYEQWAAAVSEYAANVADLTGDVAELSERLDIAEALQTDTMSGSKIVTYTSDALTAQYDSALQQYYVEYAVALPAGASVLETAWSRGASDVWQQSDLRTTMSASTATVRHTLEAQSAYTFKIRVTIAYPESADLAELQDIRVGADGTVYASAGAAVRAQAMKLDSTLTEAGKAADAKATGDAIADLKDDFNDLGGTLISEGTIKRVYKPVSVSANTTTIASGLFSGGSSGTNAYVYEISAGTNIVATGGNVVGYYATLPVKGSTYTIDNSRRVGELNNTKLTVPTGASYVAISATSESFVIEDAKTTSEIVDIFKDELIPSSEKDLTIVIGTLENGQDTTLNTRCKTLDYIPVSTDDYVVFDDSSYQLSVTEYNENKRFISVSGWISANRYKVSSGAYIRAVIKRNDNAVISDEDIATAKENLYIFNASALIKNVTASVNKIIEAVADISFQSKVRNALLVGWQHNGNGTYTYREPITRNTITTPIYTEYKTMLLTDASHQFALQFFDGYETGEEHLLRVTTWLHEYTIQPGEYFCLTLRNADNSTTSEETNNYLTVSSSKPINLSVSSNSEALDLINNKTNYSVSESLKTRGVSLERMGVLTYLQAFCKYNNSYYSTNGTNISVQDSAFAETNNVAINLGHGNSMQIGTLHKNYAYVSGWNDQKVYVVNLDTLVIADTITLPTTGYTTAAIDDINGIAYIFQRATYPSTEESYNFIVYDYVNNETISTKKTYRPFAAMQSVEFYEGKIYVLNGLGTAEAPNYYLIYNTNGDIIGEYIISDFSNTEPEGVYIDRKTREIYLSLVNKAVYKMS